MKQFEVGKTYSAYKPEYGSIEILRRSEKTIWVRNDCGIEWFMRIKKDADGNEFAIDSVLPKKWQVAFTYIA